MTSFSGVSTVMNSLLIVLATKANLPVQRHIGIWSSPPSLTPGTGGVVDGPLLGNGDLGVTGSGTDNHSSVVARKERFLG